MGLPSMSSDSAASSSLPEWFTISEALHRWRISKGTYYRWMSEGYAPRPARLGPRTLRLSKAAILEFEARVAADGLGR